MEQLQQKMKNQNIMNYTLITGKYKEIILRKINSQNNEKRRKQLDEYLDELHKLGFYIELLPQIEPKYFVEKQGFSIKEALILTRRENQIRPSDEEINQLKYDEETNILKLEFQNIPFQINDKKNYIIILGPTKRGKTTFIFNLINYIFNVQYNSMYRVKKKENQTKQYYDEYYIQISGKNYVFVDFRGIGELKLDFLGLDQTGVTNIYIEILKYICDKIKINATIAAIFYINSSSINRLTEDESYCLQRFFELVPKTIIKNNKFFLVLTYCSDNQPKINIYEQSESTPLEFKEKLKNQKISYEQKFWYSINNKPLYEPLIYQQQDQGQYQYDTINLDLQRLIKCYEQGTGDFLEPQKDESYGQELLLELDSNQEIEIDEGQLHKQSYNLMTDVIKDIIEKFENFSDYNDNQTIFKYFEQQLKYEYDVLELLKLYRLNNKEKLKKKEAQIIQSKNTYLLYELKQSLEKIKKGYTFIYCSYCQTRYCQTRYCFRQQKDENLAFNLNQIFQDNQECLKCKKRNFHSRCHFENHIIVTLNEGQEILKQTQVAFIHQRKYCQMIQNFSSNKRSKELYRLYQSAKIKAQLNYQYQIQKIKNNSEDISKSSKNGENCININLYKRAKYLNVMMYQLENNFEMKGSFYKQLKELIEIYDHFLLQPKNNYHSEDNFSDSRMISKTSQLMKQQYQQQQLEQIQILPHQFQSSQNQLENAIKDNSLLKDIQSSLSVNIDSEISNEQLLQKNEPQFVVGKLNEQTNQLINNSEKNNSLTQAEINEKSNFSTKNNSNLGQDNSKLEFLKSYKSSQISDSNQ
ncbi:unnamed protein product [Paramecium sonneborni]|uniref:G domain-containing protein n=1 Tax=Paramecium sonneborni TaxID=65129 RepID=A0A8S1R4E7_9CILI|nr:unnamed protein product [Paramecium sonneborni]